MICLRLLRFKTFVVVVQNAGEDSSSSADLLISELLLPKTNSASLGSLVG